MKLNFEQRSGMSFDDVRVHYNSGKPAQFHALAYTQGTQIYIGPGQERSLPHELGHVIQQKAGRVRPTRWVRGQPVNDQPELEREADRAPVQCMPAPALWGVIQMTKFGVLPSQRGTNCGYHALARAIYALYDDPAADQFAPNNLEIRLTTYAIEQGYSVMGEAFDPDILAEVGNKFCETDWFCKEHPIKCSVLPFTEKTRPVIQAENKKGSVILVPYFPNMNTWGPEGSGLSEGAHWGVIGAKKTLFALFGKTVYDLYEGNRRGSVGLPGHLPPLPVTLEAMLESNKSIVPTFNWDVFWTENLSMINKWEADVNMNTDKKKGAFAEEGALIDRLKAVKETIKKAKQSPDSDSPLPDHVQEVLLKGKVVLVKKA